MEAKKPKHHGKDGHGQFDPNHRTMIYDYYGGQSAGLPPGLAKRNGALPPGLEKQLQRNGRLPPGLEKKLTPFPADLERRFPPLPAGMRRGVIENRGIIYDPRSRTILDVVPLYR